jgi:excisionase family DNA binding protein
MRLAHVVHPISDTDLMSPRTRRIHDFVTSARCFVASDELLDITQVAARLGVPRSTIYELTRNRAHVRHSHPLPCFKVGRRLKFNWSSVVAWLDTLEKEGV